MNTCIESNGPAIGKPPWWLPARDGNIGYPSWLMWDMTGEEVAAYSTKSGPYLLPLSVMQKYGFHSQYTPTWDDWYRVSPCQYLVARYCDTHHDIGEKYVQREVLYYDVLEMAEAEYLGLPSFRDRRKIKAGLVGIGV